MPQYQNKQVSASAVIRPRYGVLRSVYVGGASNKSFTIHNAQTIADCNSGNELLRIQYPNAPIQYPNLHVPFGGLTVIVETESGSTEDGSRLLLQID